jgi:outer membrane receptor for ferrienterochelin and colicin
MVGYERIETEKVLVDGRHEVIEKNIVLRENTETLNELVVVGNKNFIEQTVDKMVINPEASATAGSENVFEILKKLPGVNVDNSDNITLKGMTGVKVLIDDKPTYLSSSQLAAMLKGMQGKNVDRIEIIENPSARYDAEGNSGIINIKTKHVKAPLTKRQRRCDSGKNVWMERRYRPEYELQGN